MLADGVVDDGYTVHPTLLDGCLQVLGAAIRTDEHTDDALLPIACDSISYRARGLRELWSHASITGLDGAELITANLTFFDAAASRVRFGG